MAMEWPHLRMATNTKGNTALTSAMAKEGTNGRTAVYTMEIFEKTNDMEPESSHGQTVPCTKVISRMVNERVMECTPLAMEVNTMVLGKMADIMATVLVSGKMADVTRASG